MDNLHIYNKVRSVPDEAKKPIKGGRLRGMTDINPMWRIKVLTEAFGPCGVGWKYDVSGKWTESGANGEIAAFVDVNLYIKHGETWSEAIPGTGGSAFVTKEKSGLYTSDECYKMALTDALGVACKALGVAADVYWDKDRTKYDIPTEVTQEKHNNNPQRQGNTITKVEAKKLFEISRGNVTAVKSVISEYGYEKTEAIKREHYPEICDKIEIMVKEIEA
jgi:hypothetical protein